MDSSVDGSMVLFVPTDSFISSTPWAIVCTTSECRSRMWISVLQKLNLENKKSISKHVNKIRRSKILLFQILFCGFDLFEFDHFLKASGIPGVYQIHRWRPQQIVRQQGDLLHDVGQSHRQLLAQKDVRLLFTGIQT